MKLTNEQIKTIDVYLMHADIRFIDVRMEMIDHVATSVEHKMLEDNLSFYDTFKNFMVLHKKELLKDYKKLKKKNQLKGFWKIGAILKKPWMLILLGMLFWLIYSFENLMGFQFPFGYFLWIITIGAVLIYFLFSRPLNKNRFSGIESVSWVLFVLLQFTQVFSTFSHEKPLFYDIAPWLVTGITAFVVGSCIAFVIVFFKERNFYKKRYT